MLDKNVLSVNGSCELGLESQWKRLVTTFVLVSLPALFLILVVFSINYLL